MGTTTGAVLAIKALDLPLIVIVGVVTVSVMFGIIVHRADDPQIGRRSLFNAGAVWLLAFALGVHFAGNIVTLALIALGTGLAGEKALDVLEVSVMRLVEVAMNIVAGRKAP